ncbi:MAG: inner membrane protein YiaA [Rhizobiaceae bacterium]
MNQQLRPTNAFVGASWAVLIAGILSYLVGLWNASMLLNEKGYYFTLLLFGLFGVVSLQKTVRDKIDGIPVTNIYYGLCWVAVGSAILLMGIGLFNATLLMSEKGFFAMAYLVSGFAAVAVQKNVRDIATLGPLPGSVEPENAE